MYDALYEEYVGIRWNTYSTSPPQHISAVARRVLACAARLLCASAAERNWSVYGAIKTTARGQMGQIKTDTSLL